MIDTGESCDAGPLNGQSLVMCNVDCTIARCGDAIQQDWLGEVCDDGPQNGVIDLLTGGCTNTCTRPVCSDEIDNDGDGVVDGGDGGCHAIMCDVNSPWNKGDPSEDNPCRRGARPNGQPSPYNGSVPVGGFCEYDDDCYGYGGPSSSVFCAGGSQQCTDLSVSGGLQGQAGNGLNIPVCPPDNCNQFVGFPGDCLAGGNGDTCAAQDARTQCLLQSAINRNMCPNGQIMPVFAGEDWSCSNGAAPNQQWMCGPAGKWKCFCPGNALEPLWQRNLQQCPVQCGNGRKEQGEECDDGNQDNGDACSNACKSNGNGQCDGVKACEDPAAVAACAADGGKVCKPDTNLPCMKCVEQVVGECDGTECSNGGDAFCAASNQECSLTDKSPCITCIGKNSCGNGEINASTPRRVEAGCSVAGTAQQYCVPEGLVLEDFGEFTPEARCYAAADCVKNEGGSCDWNITPAVQACLDDAAGTGAEARSFGGRAPVAQLAGGNPPVKICPKDLRPCCRGGVFSYVERDPVTCSFPACEADMRSCRNIPRTCVRAGCNGERCVLRDETVPPVTSCGFSQDAACYDSATCAWNGTACAWTMTPELTQCLRDNADSSCPTDQSCLSRTACMDGGGSPGKACGAGNANVCCLNPDVDVPLEQCDDGNQIDTDECGNDCLVNCQKNADCPEGACVNGQCVDQCAEPNAGDGGPLGAQMDSSVAVLHGFWTRMMAFGTGEHFDLLP